MNLESQVASLELSKQLASLLGDKAPESLFCWLDLPGGLQVALNDKKWLGEWYPAYTASELHELLPYKITAHQINHAYPIPDVADGTDAELDALEEARDKFRDLFKDLEWECADQFDDGMPYDIIRDYHTGTTIRYYQQSDDWECNYPVIETSGDTEADARAKMLIYLLTNKLI